jgi:hypothetical protein
VFIKTSAVTRSGSKAANIMAIGPASSAAMIAVLVEPTASSTARTSSAHSSHAGMALRAKPSEAPVPRRSKKVNRLNEASSYRIRLSGEWASVPMSTWLPRP